MRTKSLSASVAIILLLQLTVSSAFSSTKAEKDAQRLAQVKAEIAKRGTDLRAPIRIKMLNGATLKGVTEDFGPEGFLFREAGAGTPRVIAYSDVAEVKGKEPSTCQKVAFWWGVLAVVSLVASRGNR